MGSRGWTCHSRTRGIWADPAGSWANQGDAVTTPVFLWATLAALSTLWMVKKAVRHPPRDAGSPSPRPGDLSIHSGLRRHVGTSNTRCVTTDVCFSRGILPAPDGNPVPFT